MGTKCKDAFGISRSSLCRELKNRHAMLSGGSTEVSVDEVDAVGDKTGFSGAHVPTAAAVKIPSIRT
ncbi:hypothetical protein CLOM_g20220 [Closterium sp. NIES-68]|nr:hypothetical protein CLOM_g20220 [Closterium sp. NIES-68]